MRYLFLIGLLGLAACQKQANENGPNGDAVKNEWEHTATTPEDCKVYEAGGGLDYKKIIVICPSTFTGSVGIH